MMINISMFIRKNLIIKKSILSNLKLYIFYQCLKFKFEFISHYTV